MSRQEYLIDGYNVINSWPELKNFGSDLAAARDKLVAILTEFGAFENCDITVVYDAPFNEEAEHKETLNRHFAVIYTGAGNTADSRIERLAYEAAKAGREVHVVTSDGAEQSVILGAGAYRIPSLEFRKTVHRMKKELRAEYLGEVTLPLARHILGERIAPEVAAKLDELRKKVS